MLLARGEIVANDHIALRAFDRGGCGMEQLGSCFERYGYTARGSYRFEDKHLVAQHYEHPDSAHPRVFISELLVDALSPAAQAVVDGLLTQVQDGLSTRPDLPVSGRPWSTTWSDWEQLRAESEYAAWLAAFGYRANHFTVDVDRLNTVSGLAELNELLRAGGLALNESGGAIKGSPEVGLEQSSTLAGAVPVTLGGETREIPGCYYEFAQRHRGFSGFVTQSANTIFESTDVRDSR
ncbi:MAG: hypothetical protein ACI9WU_004633 [Myxococcota bacterium]